MLVEEGGAFPTENGLQDERNIDMMIAEMQGVSDVAAPKPIVGPADDAYSSIQDPLEGEVYCLIVRQCRKERAPSTVTRGRWQHIVVFLTMNARNHIYNKNHNGVHEGYVAISRESRMVC